MRLMKKHIIAFVLVLLCIMRVDAQSLTGMSGLFMIPTAEVMEDRSVLLGVSYIPQPYLRFSRSVYDRKYYNHRDHYVTVTFLPRLELQFKYAYHLNHPRGNGIPMFMDRSVSGRLLLWRESKYIPAIVFGVHDPGREAGFTTNRHYGANYLVGSKNIGVAGLRMGLHGGYAFEIFGEPSLTYQGAFGGVSVSSDYTPWLQLIAEHDSYRYNVAGRLVLFDRVQLMAGLLDLKDLSGNVTYRFQF